MRSRVVAVLLCSTVVVGLTACGSSAGSDDAATTSDAREPVVVDHVFGSTEITEVPQRVVTIDLQWTDTLLALDVAPVGYTVDPGGDAYPWQDLPADATAIELNADYSVPVERIAALQPDLIVGSYSIGDQATYDLLSDIAPTIPNLDEQQVTPWQDLLSTAGRILDREDEAAAVRDDVDGQVAAVADELPGLAGTTFVLAQYVVGDSIYAVADEADGSSIFFQDLGMQLYPPVVSEGRSQATARVAISVERADLLGADLVAFLINGGDESALADIPGFAQLPGTVAILDLPTIVGLNTPTPLSLPYSLDALRPSLETAAA